MAGKCFLTNFRITGDLKFTTDGKRVDFPICSAVKHHNNGQYLKIWLSAFDEQANRIARLKAKKGSLVDVVAEMIPYAKEGRDGIGYKVLDISYSEGHIPYEGKENNENGEQQAKKTETQEDKLRKTAQMLATNPFS